MQINDRHHSGPVSRIRRDGVHTSVEKGHAQEAPLPVQTSITGYLQELQGLPELRSDVVARVRQRFLAGEYLTREAAQATAGALLPAG